LGRVQGTVDFSDTYSTIATLYQRKTFFASDNFWLFYGNGSNLFYTSSSDGSNWRASTAIASVSSSSAMSVWYDGASAIVKCAIANGQLVTILQGEISGEAISWSDNQTLVQGNPSNQYYNGYCTVGSDGNTWISYFSEDDSKLASTGSITYSVQVIRRNLGTEGHWNLAQSNIVLRPCILPLLDGKVFLVYSDSDMIRGRLWNGTDWQEPEIITNRHPVHDFGYSVVTLNDEVHLAFLENATNSVFHYRRTTDGLWRETLLEANQHSFSSPELSVDSSRKTVYCIWMQSDGLQMRKLENGVWKNLDKLSLSLVSPTSLSCFYQVDDGKLGIALLERDLSQSQELYRLRYVVADVSK
jgi:hypothetical protein